MLPIYDGVSGYRIVNNVKHGEMDDEFKNTALATEARDSVFTEKMTTNGNLYTQLRYQEYHIRALQAELCSLKVAAAMRPVDVKTNKTGQPYA